MIMPITLPRSGLRSQAHVLGIPKARIWAIWQPHTYSRTKTLFLDFARAFKDADKVIVTEVYAAREPKQDFTSAEIVSAMPHLSALLYQDTARSDGLSVEESSIRRCGACAFGRRCR